MSPYLSSAINAGQLLVHQFGAGTEVALIGFDDDSRLDVPLTDEVSQIEYNLQRFQARRGTAFLDAILMATHYLRDNARHQQRVVVAIVNGNENSSSTTLNDTIRAAQSADIPVYVVAPDVDLQGKHDTGKTLLRRLTAETGGKVFFSKTGAEMNLSAGKVARLIRSSYDIAYSPGGPADGKFHPIHVALQIPGPTTVSVKSGYFAETR